MRRPTAVRRSTRLGTSIQAGRDELRTARAPQQVERLARRAQIDAGRGDRNRKQIGDQQGRRDAGANLGRQIDHHMTRGRLEAEDARDPSLGIALAAERQALDRDWQITAGVPVRRGGLGIGIDQHHRLAALGESAGKIDGDRALAGAALEIADRDDVTHWPDAPTCVLGPGGASAALSRPARRRDRPVTGASGVLQTPVGTVSGQG